MENRTIQVYLSLLHDAEISPAAFGKLLARFGSLSDIQSQCPSTLAAFGLSREQITAIKTPNTP